MAIDVDKQIYFWRKGAEDALSSAEVLIANGRWGFGLFLAHLALEKLLKAQVVRKTGDIPPRSHDLLRLMQQAQLAPPADLLAILGEFQAYCLAGRYPDAEPAVIDATLAQREFARAKETYAWLQRQFNK